MAIRKLVELDEETWGWSEVDPVKLKRVAMEFKAWLLKLPPEQDTFGFLKKDLPIVESALNGSMQLPYKGWEPHNWELREGLLPREYTQISAPFYNTARGAHLTPPSVVERDGKRYAWTEFEEPNASDVTH